MSTRNNQIRVAVYGTLKQGQSNHSVLKGSRFLGLDCLGSISLYDLGPFPAALEQPSDGVLVEVYEVNIPTFARLDDLEDYSAYAPRTGLYNRKLFDTAFGRAWVYLFNGHLKGAARVLDGNWTEVSVVQALRRSG